MCVTRVQTLAHDHVDVFMRADRCVSVCMRLHTGMCIYGSSRVLVCTNVSV